MRFLSPGPSQPWLDVPDPPLRVLGHLSSGLPLRRAKSANTTLVYELPTAKVFALPLIDKDCLGLFLVLSIQDCCNKESEKKEGDVFYLKVGINKDVGGCEEECPNAKIQKRSY